MLRTQLARNDIESGAFRWRSHEISRVEGLSDAVFGFAITLLVVSLEVPKTFNELLEAMRGFGLSPSVSPCFLSFGTTSTNFSAVMDYKIPLQLF